MKALYAIYDNKAEDLLGKFAHIMSHDAVAIRMFGDVCEDKNTEIARHIEDYDLVCLGEIQLAEDGPTTTPYFRVVITGEQWAASQRTGEQQ